MRPRAVQDRTDFRPSSVVATGSPPAAVLIVDPLPMSQRRMAGEFVGRGSPDVWAAGDLDAARAILEGAPVSLIVTEMRFPGGSYLDLLSELRQRALDVPLIVATSAGSIALAVRAVRQGCAGFFTRPVTAAQIIRSLGQETGPDDSAPLTLDEAIWEYISRAVDASGSLAGAARWLGIERRSLKRMLIKYAPPGGSKQWLAPAPRTEHLPRHEMLHGPRPARPAR